MEVRSAQLLIGNIDTIKPLYGQMNAHKTECSCQQINKFKNQNMFKFTPIN